MKERVSYLCMRRCVEGEGGQREVLLREEQEEGDAAKEAEHVWRWRGEDYGGCDEELMQGRGRMEERATTGDLREVRGRRGRAKGGAKTVKAAVKCVLACDVRAAVKCRSWGASICFQGLQLCL